MTIYARLTRYLRLVVILLLTAFTAWWTQAGYTEPANPNVVINEFLASNASTNIDTQFWNFSDWIELHNTSGSPADISSYYLSDDELLLTKWQFPAGTIIPAGGYLLVWADNLNTGLHTNFRLSDDEIIILSNASGVEFARLDYNNNRQLPDVSYGRSVDGGPTWLFFSTPTPGFSNNSAVGVVTTTLQIEAPLFSPVGGFYPAGQSVTLSAPNGGQIYYTTDGTTPTTASTLYTAPIAVTTTTPIRARIFANGYLPSETKTQTYLINENITLPVISLTTDPDYLWDDTIGIYVSGTNGAVGPCEATPRNWNQDWERPMSFEYYEPQSTGGALEVDMELGVSIFGNCTRNLEQKSLTLTARDQYGDKDIDYPFFPDRENDDFVSIVLRNSANDWVKGTLYRDAMMQELTKGQMDLDWQGYRPTIVFLNGQYWGLHNVRERLDEYYLEDNHGVDPENVDIIKNRNEVQEGTYDDYDSLLDYIEANKNIMNNAAVWTEVNAQMDVSQFKNYQIAEIYVGNTDWPGNNLRYWRTITPDSQWRWMIFDTDYGFAYSSDPDDPTKYKSTYDMDTLTAALNSSHNNWPNPAWATYMLRMLLRNNSFKAEFIQTFAAHINLTFEQGRVIGIIDQMQDVIEPDMPRNINRWKWPNGGVVSSMTQWEQVVEITREFGRQRPTYMRGFIQTQFNVPGTYNLTSTVSPAGTGTILIHDVPTTQDTHVGVYFDNITSPALSLPVRLEAVPITGYKFVEWRNGANVLSTSPTYSIPGRTTDYQITAVFAPAADLVINEIHYNPATFQEDDGHEYEFLELYNNDTVAVNLSGYSFSGITFTFPATATLGPGEYLIVTPDSAAFANATCPVYQYTGGLAGGGELIDLRDNLNNPIDVVLYDDVAPWPIAPDGNGPSAELISPTLDNSIGSNWEASLLIGGTPCLANNTIPDNHPVVINEIHYNPADAQGVDATYEFVEIYNNSSNPVDISGYRFRAGIVYTFPAGTILAPNEFVLVAANSNTYDNLGFRVFQATSGSLNNGGEWLWLVDSNGQEVDSANYDDLAPWPTTPNGTGPSLELKLPHLPAYDSANWEPSAGLGGTFGRHNNEDTPTGTWSGTTVTEGNSGSVTTPITLTLNYANAVTMTVNFATADDTATAGEDYTAASGTVVIPPLTLGRTQSLTIVGDTIYEPDEAFEVSFTAPSGLVLSNQLVTVNILNNDSPPVLSLSSPIVLETSGSAVLTVTLTGSTALTAMVNYATANGTATAGQDYTAASGTLTFAPGVTTQTISVPILNNGTPEVAENFTVNLSNPSQATVSNGVGTVTILDDDGEPTLAVTSVSVSEAAPTGTVTVLLSPPAAFPITVDYVTEEGTAAAGEDYTAASGTVTFEPGEVAQTITFVLLPDSLHELDEQFELVLSNAVSATIGQDTGVITIEDDDPQPTAVVEFITQDEGNTTAVLPVEITLSAVSSLDTTFDYATQDGTATAGEDYQAAAGQITIPAGLLTTTLPITIWGDVLVEPDEHFLLTVGGQMVTVTLVNDDSFGLFAVDAELSEGDTATQTVTVTVLLSAAGAQTVMVNFATQDSTATAGEDYQAITGTLTFNPGETSHTVVIPVLGDEVVEGDELFELVLSEAVNAPLGDDTAVITIFEDDLPHVTIADAQVAEGDSGSTAVTLTVSLSAASVQTVTVNFATQDITATAGVDYEAMTGTVTFAPGETSQTIVITIFGDEEVEEDEIFHLVLSEVENASLVDDTAEVTIEDDDEVTPPAGYTLFLPVVVRP